MGDGTFRKSTQNGTQKGRDKVGQEQIHGLLFGEKLSWQAIIYDLINSEQLDPWDIDISLLSRKYLDKVKGMGVHNFFVSSKVLLAASLLLRLKSEILLSQDLRSLDDILFNREKAKKYVQERIELDEDIPELVPRTPLPRFRRVSLKELMNALGKAIRTETRRIKRVVVERQHEIELAVTLPKNRINIRDEMRGVYSRLKKIFSGRGERVAFSDFAGKSKEEKVAAFIPLLHLDNQHRVLMEQDSHFEEIYIWLKEVYDKKNYVELKKLEKEVEEELEREEAEEKSGFGGFEE